MTAIVCVSKNWGIGRDGTLLFRISADLKRFKSLTVGKTVILGRKTLDTFPGGRPLKDRCNIVLSHRDDNPDWRVASESEVFEENGLKFQFVDYVRNH